MNGNGKLQKTHELDDEVSHSISRLHRQHFTQDNAYPDSPPRSRSQSDASVATMGDKVVPPSPRPSFDLKESSSREPSVPGTPRTLAKRHTMVNLSKKQTQSILDSRAGRESVFFGFYTLFWVMMGCTLIRQMAVNFMVKQQVIGFNIISILTRDLLKIALTDLAMYLATYEAYLLQVLVYKGYVNWDRFGWLFQNVYQAVFLFTGLWFTNYMNFPWIGGVFLLLHSLVFIMKMHSYAFYNGYFWHIMRRLKRARELLARTEHEECDPVAIEDLTQEIDFCVEEIKMQSSRVQFPENINLRSFFEYSMFPTLIYQIEYPRTETFRLSYFLKKTAATFGTFWCMIAVAEEYLYPVAVSAMSLRDEPLHVKVQMYPIVLLDLLPGFALIYLLTFYIIWDAILNGIAELTFFGDREFYGEWWNSVSWDQFAKDWNVPVHRFLLRHVYHSSMSALNISKGGATIITFLLSSMVHELVMYSIFRKLRGYLFLLQMSQIPLVMVSRTKYLRDKRVLGNVIFWIGICTGPSIMCSLYLTF